MSIYKFLAIPAACATISVWWAIKKYRESETEACSRQDTTLDNVIMIDKDVRSKNCVSIPVEEITKDKENPSDLTPSSANVENEIVLQDQGQQSNAPTASINERTKTPVEGVLDEEGVRALEERENVEEKGSHVEEISNDKENQSDLGPSLANVENKEVLQDQKPSNSQTASIHDRTTEESVSHSSVKNTGKSSDKKLKSKQSKDKPFQTPLPKIEPLKKEAPKKPDAKEGKRRSQRQKRDEELENLHAELDLENAGKKKSENQKIEEWGSWDTAKAGKKKDKNKNKKVKEEIVIEKPQKEPEEIVESLTMEKVARAIKDTTAAKKKQDEKKKKEMEDAKMVFLVRTDLGMGKGKVAAQVAHAAVDCYINAEESNPDTVVEWMLSGGRRLR